jgi:hypothetical protein
MSNENFPSNTYSLRQDDFNMIPGSPWVYWIDDEIRNLFRNMPVLGDIAQPIGGCQTSDNFRFFRYWWEVGVKSIAYNVNNTSEALLSHKKWFPTTKGGTSRWLNSENEIILWKNDGAEIKQYIVDRYEYLKCNWEWVAKNPNTYFHQGLAVSRISPTGIRARISIQGQIKDSSLSGIFPKESDNLAILGILNSVLAYFMLTCINPTINFQAGDVARLPYPENIRQDVLIFVLRMILLTFSKLSLIEGNSTFIIPGELESEKQLSNQIKMKVLKTQSELDNEIYKNYGLNPKIQSTIKAELGILLHLDV